MTTQTIAPILITKTRSFWLGGVPAALSLLEFAFVQMQSDQAGPIAGALAMFLDPLFGWSATEITAWVQGIAPLYTFVVMWQRAGLSRPYTADPAKERLIVRTIEDGKSAFEAGKAFGERLKARGS